MASTALLVILQLVCCSLVLVSSQALDWNNGWDTVLKNQGVSGVGIAKPPRRPSQPSAPPYDYDESDVDGGKIYKPPVQLSPHPPRPMPRKLLSPSFGVKPSTMAPVAKGTVLDGDGIGDSVKMVDKDAILDAHNAYRALAGVPPLVWSEKLAEAAQAHSTKCIFEHSHQGYGENLIMGNYNTPDDLVRGVTMWYGEICYYDFSKPGFSMSTGHYSQQLWKATRSIGCGFTYCVNGVRPFNKYSAGIMVCEYDPPGNYIGQFKENVLKPRVMPECNTGIIKWDD